MCDPAGTAAWPARPDGGFVGHARLAARRRQRRALRTRGGVGGGTPQYRLSEPGSRPDNLRRCRDTRHLFRSRPRGQQLRRRATIDGGLARGWQRVRAPWSAGHAVGCCDRIDRVALLDARPPSAVRRPRTASRPARPRGWPNAALVTLGTAPAYSVGGVPRGTYYVRVRAMNPAGVGPPSGDATVTVP